MEFDMLSLKSKVLGLFIAVGLSIPSMVYAENDEDLPHDLTPEERRDLIDSDSQKDCRDVFARYRARRHAQAENQSKDARSQRDDNNRLLFAYCNIKPR
jgi:hypothetical protein